MANEDIEDIDDLLDQLDDIDKSSSVEDIVPDQMLPPQKVEFVEHDILDDIEGITEPDLVLRPVDVRKYDLDNNSAQEEQASNAPILSLDVEVYRSQLKIVTDEVLDSCRSDRQEAQDVINMLRGMITAGPGPTKAVIDGLVKAVEVKANINQNAIRMMDTNCKFLSAIKSTVNIKQEFAVSPEELNEALENIVEIEED